MASLSNAALVLFLLNLILVVTVARDVRSHKSLARTKRSNHDALERDLRFKGKGKGSSDCIRLSSSKRRNLREISSSKGKGSLSSAPVSKLVTCIFSFLRFALSHIMFVRQSFFCSEEPSPSPTLSHAPTTSEAPTGGTGKSGKGGKGKSGKSGKKGKGSKSSAPPIVNATDVPTMSPTTVPPTVSPTTAFPTVSPTLEPTATPTLQPSDSPTVSTAPSGPTDAPSSAPGGPTLAPSDLPSQAPSDVSCDVRLERLQSITVDELVDEIFLDIKGNGRSPGDVYVFEGNELTDNYSSGQRGVSNGRCVVLQDDSFDENVYCAMEFAYPEGSIFVQGFFGQMMIVGGTGCYVDVQGYLIPGPSGIGVTSFFFDIHENGITCIDPSSLFQFPWVDNDNGEFVTWDNNGPTVGDIYVFDNHDFFNSAGILQGTVEGECILVRNATDNDKSFCMVTFNTFAGDKLTAQGIHENMVITGGTSCFFGASGTVQGNTPNGRGSRFEYNVDLQFPGDLKPPTCPPAAIFADRWVGPLIGQPIDYRGDGDSGGDLFVIDTNPLTIPSLSGTHTQTGRCAFLNDVAAQQYCNIVVSLGAIGQIALQGYFNEMTIVGGSGCFQGLQGTVVGDNTTPAQVTYTWSIVEDP